MRWASVALLAVLSTVAACGDEGSAPGEPARAAVEASVDERQIRELVTEFFTALAARDYGGVCSTFTPAFREGRTSAVQDLVDRPATCELAIRGTIAKPDQVGNTGLKAVDVSGATATGQVGRDNWEFEKSGSGDWKIAYLN